jgi:hypothetical protein
VALSHSTHVSGVAVSAHMLLLLLLCLDGWKRGIQTTTAFPLSFSSAGFSRLSVCGTSSVGGYTECLLSSILPLTLWDGFPVLLFGYCHVMSGEFALTRTFESTLCFVCLLALADGWEINGEGEGT